MVVALLKINQPLRTSMHIPQPNQRYNASKISKATTWKGGCSITAISWLQNDLSSRTTILPPARHPALEPRHHPACDAPGKLAGRQKTWTVTRWQQKKALMDWFTFAGNQDLPWRMEILTDFPIQFREFHQINPKKIWLCKVVRSITIGVPTCSYYNQLPVGSWVVATGVRLTSPIWLELSIHSKPISPFSQSSSLPGNWKKTCWNHRPVLWIYSTHCIFTYQNKSSTISAWGPHDP